MIWVLVLTALLLISSSFLIGVGVSPWLLPRLMPATGAHAVPAPHAEPTADVPQPRHTVAPRTTLLALEPPPTIRADLPVKPARTTGPQPWPTAGQPVLTPEAEAGLTRQPTDEQTHDLYFGGRPVADVLAAQDEARVDAGWVA